MSCLFFCPLLSLICLLRFKYISNLIGNYILTNYCGPSYMVSSCGLFYGPSYVASSCGLILGIYVYVGIIKLVFY